MAVFGASLLLMQRTVGADSYVVSASVQAPIPTVPAKITSPDDQFTTTSANIVISGTCPIIMPAIVVEIFRNDTFIGSAGCSAMGEFSGTFNVGYGSNILVPKIITITNDYGPEGTPITVIYPAPIVPVVSTTKKAIVLSKESATPPAFQVLSSTPFLVFKQNESFVWKVDVRGGVSPYSILVDWGDGTKTTYAASSSGEQKLEHIFKKNQNTVVRVSVKDALGKEVYTTVAGVTFRQPSSPLVNGATASAAGRGISIASLWAGYGILLATIFAFWLGAKTQSNQHDFLLKTKKTKLAHKRK